MSDSHATLQAPPLAKRTGILVGVGLVFFTLCHLLAGREEGLWLPGLGIGLALVAWTGLRVVVLLAINAILVGLLVRENRSISQVCLDGLLLATQVGVSWWAYHTLAGGKRRPEEPRSATVFLILIPGVLSAVFALAQAGLWKAMGLSRQDLGPLTGTLWISRILGILTLTPFLLAGLTPWLVRRRAVSAEPRAGIAGGIAPADWTWGEVVESGGLCLGAIILALGLVALHIQSGTPSWNMWGLSLLLVVWASLRQGLRGGALVSLASGVAGLSLASWQALSAADFSPLQGTILAQCSTALLVGASAGWIRASEARYRQFVGQMPVVLYSVRLPRGFSVGAGGRPAKTDLPLGQRIVRDAEVTLVSSAARKIFQTDAEALMGPYSTWLDCAHPEDRELLLAALTQLFVHKQPVSCEYRLALEAPPPAAQEVVLPPNVVSRHFRWVRDTLAPNHRPDGALDGWEGVVEDITEQRALSQTLRRTTGMFQALITHLPTGVFFVQGPLGLPLLVNARARQLLGQREDLAAGVSHLPRVYRLHRPDGTPYPVEDLPVAKALREGVTSMANDIIVHRPDGRRIPLITWAAPVNIGGGASPDAAVWVLEDLSALQHAEQARKETEARLRAVIETMAEGILVQDQEGRIIECNPAACAILGATAEALVGRAWLAENGCLREDGSPLPREEHPDRRVLQTRQPVRNFLMGIRGPGEERPRWIYVSAMPLPPGNALTPNIAGARVVTTFADLTALRQAQEDLRRVHHLELVGRIAGGTLHDFNNLLTVMLGLAAMARQALPEDHAARQDLERLEEVAEQAGHLAGQLLAFGKQRLKPPHAVDLNTVVMHALKILRSAIPSHIQIEQRLTADNAVVLADETQLKQVVMNLFLNARDAIREPGTITVSTRRGQPGQANGEPQASWVCLAVEDTGAGMDESVRARIFEPFFSTKERGTGLGLAVVQQIVDDLGGRIQVRSRAGEGTCMEIWLRPSRELP